LAKAPGDEEGMCRPRTHLINRKRCVARDFRLGQGERRENIRRDLPPTNNAATALKIRNPPG
jgi:hypothetical protein